MFQDTVKEVREDEECYALLMLYHSDLLHDEVCFGKLTNKHCERYRMHMGWKRQEGRRELRRSRGSISEQHQREHNTFLSHRHINIPHKETHTTGSASFDDLVGHLSGLQEGPHY
ncbi:hypothetical protein HaLaN_26255 [Haematococcus lacustris]|uniref:Uncharacterized protein n=1 Tax=Haematococcus lacustris TaxID=44745 RepID=A0A6A0A5T5_HAELA|nr:hypothetical protein HaLaN_26255 [Haematococcus lacustris]